MISLNETGESKISPVLNGLLVQWTEQKITDL